MSGAAWIWALWYVAESAVILWLAWRIGYFGWMADEWCKGTALKNECKRLRAVLNDRKDPSQ